MYFTKETNFHRLFAKHNEFCAFTGMQKRFIIARSKLHSVFQPQKLKKILHNAFYTKEIKHRFFNPFFVIDITCHGTCENSSFCYAGIFFIGFTLDKVCSSCFKNRKVFLSV